MSEIDVARRGIVRPSEVDALRNCQLTQLTNVGVTVACRSCSGVPKDRFCANLRNFVSCSVWLKPGADGFNVGRQYFASIRTVKLRGSPYQSDWRGVFLAIVASGYRLRTGLGRRGLHHERSPHHDTRMPMYRAARDLLIESGYTQVSMRMFRSPWAAESSGPAYCCQNDGMVGVGCGARSYTRSLHYSDHYGVERASVASILQRYVSAPESSFTQAHYGFLLDLTEQRRRYVIQSLLAYPGLDEAEYTARFGTRPLIDFPQLRELTAEGLAHWRGEVLALTAEGMK